MKQSLIIFLVFLCPGFIACHQHPDVDITLKDGGRYFYMDADFHHSKTRQVERYIHRELGKDKNVSFVTNRTNANITLGDNTRFYMKKEPGHVLIKFDKNQNSPAAYYRIRSMCEGLKDVISNR